MRWLLEHLTVERPSDARCHPLNAVQHLLIEMPSDVISFTFLNVMLIISSPG